MAAKSRPFANVPTDALRGRIIADETARMGRELAERQARLQGPYGGTDLLRAAAQGIAAHLRQVGGIIHLGCSCTPEVATVTVSPYSFDENGRMGEVQLWALVGLLEHTAESDVTHAVRTWVQL